MTENITNEVLDELEAIDESTLTIEKFTFPGTKNSIEIHSNENGPVYLLVNPKAKKVANLGSFTKMDLNYHKSYMNAVGSWGRWPYDHPLNRYSPENYLLLKGSAPIEKINGIWTVDEFTADSYLGHVHVNFDPTPLQEAEGVSIPVPTIDKFPFGWAIVGVQENRVNSFFLGQANSTLRQSRKLLAYRAILAGRLVKVVIAPHRPYFKKLMESWSEKDEDKALRIRQDAIRGASIRRSARRQARRETYSQGNETVAVSNDGQLKETIEDTPTVVVANLEIRNLKGDIIDMSKLKEGLYDIYDQNARSIVQSDFAWKPGGMSRFHAKLWNNYSRRNCRIDA